MGSKEIGKAGLVIHIAICEDAWEKCYARHGYCMKIATQLYYEGLLKKVSA